MDMTDKGDTVIRVLIAEDDDSYRDALSGFCRQWDGLECVGSAATTSEAVRLAEGSMPDVVLLDVHIPDDGGPAAVPAIRSASPGSRVLVLSAYADRATVVQMLRAGVAGYLVKGARPREIADGIRRVARGEAVLSSHITGDVLEELTWQLNRTDALVQEVAEFDDLRDELLNVLSHELLTPVTVLQGSASALARAKGQLDPERLDSLVSGIERAGAGLQRLVRNIQTSARLKHRGLDSRRLVAVERLLQGALQEIPDGGGRVEVALNEEQAALKVVGDEVLASRALALVLENAVQLSPPDQPVRVTVRSSNRDVDVMVEDHGPGVPKELRDDIFKPFRQADTSDRRSHPGLGLGLSLATMIMERHGGEILLEDPSDVGSVFVLRFPNPDPVLTSHRSP